ncbi:unnamed protein product, partial [Ceratitis capitata]
LLLLAAFRLPPADLHRNNLSPINAMAMATLLACALTVSVGAYKSLCSVLAANDNNNNKEGRTKKNNSNKIV